MRHYSLSDVVTAEQFGRVLKIVAQETAAQRTPHRAIVQYIQSQPSIAQKCADLGLLTDFFAYQLEAIAQRNPPATRRLSNDEQWSLDYFNTLAEGAVWAVPRSGLLFRKEGKTLVLFARMPYIDEMQAAANAGEDVPKTAQALRDYQDTDYAKIAEIFAGAGITVTTILK